MGLLPAMEQARFSLTSSNFTSVIRRPWQVKPQPSSTGADHRRIQDLSRVVQAE